jgi:hypothetical protein
MLRDEEQALELARLAWVNALRDAVDIRAQELDQADALAPYLPAEASDEHVIETYRAHWPGRRDLAKCRACGQRWPCYVRHELGDRLRRMGRTDAV